MPLILTVEIQIEFIPRCTIVLLVVVTVAEEAVVAIEGEVFGTVGGGFRKQ